MALARNPLDALKIAIEVAGGQSQLARICEVSQPSVHYWLKQLKKMPAEYVLRTEAATGVSRHYLRPDIYPVEAIEASASRWHGVDQCAALSDGALDRSTLHVAFNGRGGMKGALA